MSWAKLTREIADIDYLDGETDIESLSGSYPGKVRAIADGNVVANIDPDDTTTPVNDARAAIKSVADAGRIELPGYPVTEADTLGGNVGKPLSGIEIVGPNVKKGTPGQGTAAEIHFTTDGQKGFDLTADDDHGGLTNVIVRGPGQGGTAAPSIDFSGTARGFDLDEVYITDWSGQGITNAGGGAAFEMNWGFVQVVNCDGVPFEWVNGGAENQCDFMKLNASGGNQIFDWRAGNWTIGAMNCGGSVSGGFGVGAAMAAMSDSPAHNLQIGAVNYEPGSDDGTVSKVWTVRSSSAFRLNRLKVSGAGQPSYGVGMNISPGHKFIGHIAATVGTNGDLSTNKVEIADTPAEACVYAGSRANVDNSANSAKSLVWCLSDGLPADPYNEGTASIAAGGSATVASGSRTTGQWRVAYGIAADPNAAVAVDDSLQWDDTNGYQELVLSETSGAGGVDVDYIVY